MAALTYPNKIEGFKHEVDEMQAMISQLQDVKDEVLNKLDTMEIRISSNNNELGSGFGGNIVPLEEYIGHESDNESVKHTNEPFLDKPFFGHTQLHLKRQWLLRKFKKLVEGNEKNHEAKCFESHSFVDETRQRHLAGRKSFSSA
uniref:Uncharacterized protein n=1 Tax=Lactuca sativa TaxID=4236 RepID=A0A9R1WCS3_LACSA|nr:hypothetical protein LSAT_V11C200058880 [Lactuca sativa]